MVNNRYNIHTNIKSLQHTIFLLFWIYIPHCLKHLVKECKTFIFVRTRKNKFNDSIVNGKYFFLLESKINSQTTLAECFTLPCESIKYALWYLLEYQNYSFSSIVPVYNVDVACLCLFLYQPSLNLQIWLYSYINVTYEIAMQGCVLWLDFYQQIILTQQKQKLKF